MPSSIERSSGRVLPINMSLKIGVYENSSLCMKRALIGSPPVISLMRLSFQRRPSAVSDA